MNYRLAKARQEQLLNSPSIVDEVITFLIFATFVGLGLLIPTWLANPSTTTEVLQSSGTHALPK